jgi:hypothetical protein
MSKLTVSRRVRETLQKTPQPILLGLLPRRG